MSNNERNSRVIIANTKLYNPKDPEGTIIYHLVPKGDSREEKQSTLSLLYVLCQNCPLNEMLTPEVGDEITDGIFCSGFEAQTETAKIATLEIEYPSVVRRKLDDISRRTNCGVEIPLKPLPKI